MIFPLFLAFCCFLGTPLAQTADTLTANQTLEDGQTLVSSGQVFELGFFTPNNSSTTARYLGIWYKNIPLQVTWVANRNNPIINSSAELALSSQGSVSLQNLQNKSKNYWSVTPVRAANEPFLRLLDNGNLVLSDASVSDNSGDYLWQSFDNITDNMLPEMKLGWNLKTGLKRNLISWASAADPSSGQYMFSLESPDVPQLILWKGSQKLYRWGPWNGERFSGSNKLEANAVFDPILNSSTEEVYYTYKVVNNSIIWRLIVTPEGAIQYLAWIDNQWTNLVALQKDYCDTYGICGPYGICYDSSNSNCRCLKGFRKNNSNPLDWTSGCSRIWDLSCGNGDGFVKYKGLKLPDNSRLSGNRSSSLEECETECLKNCSCMAFTRVNVHSDGGHCLLWSGDLVDMKNYPEGGDVLYIRTAQAEIAHNEKRSTLVKKAIMATVSLSIPVLLLLGFLIYCLLWKRKRGLKDLNSENKRKKDLPLIDFGTVAAATSNFSSENELGQGGFGSVYKGVMNNGTEIAVKRLSKYSGQGNEEFMNEVRLIAQLQHRNLVKILGCCIQEDEKLLIYEYLPNKSLDSLLFDESKKSFLDWGKRFEIAYGLGRGLMYLHQDSTLRIIHRDLKASNVLLDIALNPKISDFGLARICGGDQTEGKTKRVVGTYGYMAPEYALQGRFSTKSDVYSYGVLLLEIIAGQRNTGCYHRNPFCNLVGHVWELWKEGKSMDIVDQSMDKAYAEGMVLRCIQIGLLCVQRCASDRPTMSTVVFMLGNADVGVPSPKQPAFINDSDYNGGIQSACNRAYSVNGVTITGVEAR